jgi:YfiH family protein
MKKAKIWLTPDWPAPVNIHAATTLRLGGVSCGAFNSLNIAMHVGDNVDCVQQNRQIMQQVLALPSEPIWLAQIHSNQVVKAVKTSEPPQADASYSNESGVVCAVMTADCLPLLVCTTDGRQIAAIHAGWRGLLAGVIDNTIAALQTPPSTLLVWLGPAIGVECFEVGAEVRAAFIAKSSTFMSAFTEKSNGQWLADIYQLARINLTTLGIHAIYGGDFCTVTEEARFYSYRRDKETGRMATLIWRQ